jgi:hypothetical protein
VDADAIVKVQHDSGRRNVCNCDLSGCGTNVLLHEGMIRRLMVGGAPISATFLAAELIPCS